jgi:hypothetical protein
MTRKSSLAVRRLRSKVLVPQRLLHRRHYLQVGLMDSVVLPAHAKTTTPECYDISVRVRVFELDPSENDSGGIGAFKIEFLQTRQINLTRLVYRQV